MIGFLKSRPVTVIGIVMIVIGFGLPMAVPSLATVEIDTTDVGIKTINPAGGEDSPWPVETGESVTLSLGATREDLDAYVSIDGSEKTLSYDRQVMYTYYYTNEWTVPESMNGKVKLEWRCTDGNETDTETSWIAVGAPNGEFYINNNKVNEESELKLDTKDLKFKFEATSLPSSISEIWVKVKNKSSETTDVEMTATDSNTWKGDWTAPSDGTYEISGYIYTTDGGTYQKMEIAMGIGENPESFETRGIFNVIGFLGIALVIGGLIFRK